MKRRVAISLISSAVRGFTAASVLPIVDHVHRDVYNAPIANHDMSARNEQ